MGLLTTKFLPSSEEDDDEEEDDSEEESGEIMLQSSSLSKVDNEDVMEPPAKQPRISLNLHTLTGGHDTPP